MTMTKQKKPCPTCGDPAVEAYAPFCSRRCAEVDLGNWFNEGYVVAGRAAEDIGDDGE